jgi:Uma2 family endonuclease
VTPKPTSGLSHRWVAPTGPWTEPDLRAFPDDEHRYEVVDGCLHVSPPLDGDHAALVDAIVALLGSAAPPSWRPVGRIGLHTGDSFLLPDVAVLRPGTPPEQSWVEAGDVALVVEVESPHSRRYDRCLKPAVYADAGVESYWRVERTAHGPVAHLYTRAGAGHYDLHRAVAPGRCVTAELPYAVQVAPATW